MPVIKIKVVKAKEYGKNHKQTENGMGYFIISSTSGDMNKHIFIMSYL